jgi:hypothetical protein
MSAAEAVKIVALNMSSSILMCRPTRPAMTATKPAVLCEDFAGIQANIAFCCRLT